MKQHNPILGMLAWVSISFVIGASLYALGLALLPVKTADIKQPIKVLNENKIVQKGEKLELELVISKYTNVTPEVSRNLLCDDGTVYFVPSAIQGTARPVGTYTAIANIDLPLEAPTDIPCKLEYNNEYRVNFVRTINRVWSTEKFIIKGE